MSARHTTVIVPCFNRPVLLGECLESFRAAGGDFDVLVVDDGSTEDLAAVVSRFDYVRMVRCEHGGSASARNCGIDNLEARTKFVMFFDSDDVALPGLVATRAGELAASKADAIYGDYYEQVRGNQKRSLVAVKSEGHAADMMISQTIPFGGTIMRRKVVRRVRFEDDLVGANDWAFLVAIMDAGFAFAKGEGALWAWRRGKWPRITGSKEQARGLIAIKEKLRAKSSAGRPLKVLGVTMAYNEEDCIGNALRFLSQMCDEVIAFDHGSIDGTAAAIKSFDGARYVSVDRRKTDLAGLFARISRAVRAREGWDWIVWIAADEVLAAPDGTREATRDDLIRAAERGIAVIRPRVREFWISDADGNSPNCIERMRHYRFNTIIGPSTPRAWLRTLTGNMPYGLHRHDSQWGVPMDKISRGEWLIDHYPIRTAEQGQRKIMRERKPRPKYEPFRKKQCKNLVLKADRLTCRDLSPETEAQVEADFAHGV